MGGAPVARGGRASLRARVQRAQGTVNADTERRADGTVRTDAQFYAALGEFRCGG